MSRHHFSKDRTSVTMGYDRILNYVYCVVEMDDEMLYSNLSDPHAGTECQDVNYFRPKLTALGITIPDEMYVEVAEDQANGVGNREVRWPKNE